MRGRVGRAWWFVGAGVALALLLVLAFQAFRGSTLTRQDMAAHLRFPATYGGIEDAPAQASFTLHDDGTASLSGMPLGSEERTQDDGRVCLDGDVAQAEGEARWWTDDAGWVVLEVEDRRTRFVQDDPLLVAEGWGTVYVLTPCTQEYTATFMTRDASP